MKKLGLFLVVVLFLAPYISLPDYRFPSYDFSYPSLLVNWLFNVQPPVSIIPKAEAQQDVKEVCNIQDTNNPSHNSTYGRGASYEIRDLGGGSCRFSAGLAPWIWNGTRYTAWIKDEQASYVQVQSALIAARIYNNRAEFYKPDMSDLIVDKEHWIVWRYSVVLDRWLPVLATTAASYQSRSVTTTSTYTNVSQIWSNSFGILDINYHFEGKLKHTVEFTADIAGTYLVTQIWNGTQYSQVKLSNSTSYSVGSNLIIQKTNKTLTFLFNNATQPFGIFEDQSSAQDKFIDAIFAGGTVQLGGISISNAVAWRFGNWELTAGQSLTLDPDTYSSANPTLDEWIKTLAGSGTACPAVDEGAGSGTGTTLHMGKDESGINGNCWRISIEWDITSIPAGADVTDTVFKFDVDIVSGGDSVHNECDITPMIQSGTQPSTMNDATLWTEIGDGTDYVSSSTLCRTTGNNKSLDLGTSADTDVESQLASDWFAVGVKLADEVRIAGTSFRVQLAAEEHASPTPAPTLEITYTPLVTQPITITIDNSGTGGTATISGCSVSDTTQLMDGISENHTATPSCTLTVTLPSDGANTRHRTAGGATSYTIATCASGTCTASSTTIYFQLQNTYQVTANAQTTFDASLTLAVSGTRGGSSVTLCTISPTGGAATGSCTDWGDYNRAATGLVDMSGAPANSRWRDSSGAGFTFATPTTGGNTYNRNEYKQWTNTWQATPNAQTTWDTGLTAPNVVGTSLGTASTTICSITLTGGGGAASCAGYTDHNTATVIGASTIGGAPANSRWSRSGSGSFTETTGGNTRNADYYKQWTNTYQITANAQTTLDASLTLVATGTLLGVGSSTVCTISSGGGGGATASCSDYSDHNSAVTGAATLTGAPADSRWVDSTGAGFTFATPTSGGNTYNRNEYKQWECTVGITQGGTASAFDGTVNFAITRTYLGSSGNAITLTPANLATTPVDRSPDDWIDHNSAVVYPATSTSNPVDKRYRNGADASSSSSAVTSSCTTVRDDFWAQWEIDITVTQSGTTSAFDGTTNFAATKTYLGTGGTSATVTPANLATSGLATHWLDHNTAAVFPATSSSNPANKRYQNSNDASSSSAAVTSAVGSVSQGYYAQWSTTVGITQGGTASAFDGTVNFAITRTYLGSAGNAITLTPANLATTPVDRPSADYIDHNTVISYPATSASNPVDKRYRNGADAASSSAAVTSGGTTVRDDYFAQWEIDITVTQSGVVSLFDGTVNFAATKTYLGASATAATVTPASSSSSGLATHWLDHNTQAVFPASSASNPVDKRYRNSNDASSSSSAVTSAVGSVSQAYYAQWEIDITVTQSGTTSNFDGTVDFAATKTYLGTGSTAATVTPSAATTSGLATHWLDHSTTVAFPASSTNNPADKRYRNSNDGASSSSSITSAVGSVSQAYYAQWEIDITVTQSGTTSGFDGTVDFLTTKTYLGSASTAATVTPANLATSGLATHWLDHSTTVSFPATSTNNPANKRYRNDNDAASSSSSITSAIGSVSQTYRAQWSTTVGITQGGTASAFDGTVNFPITKTYLGSAGTAITLTPSNGATTPADLPSAEWIDHSTTISFPATSASNPANKRYRNGADAASSSSAVTSGGTTVRTTYYAQWSNTCAVTRNSDGLSFPSGASAFAVTGTHLGTASSTLVSLTIASLGTANGTCWSDNNATMSWAASAFANSTQRWNQASAFTSSAVTSGGATTNRTFYHQLSIQASGTFLDSGGGSLLTQPTAFRYTINQFASSISITSTSATWVDRSGVLTPASVTWQGIEVVDTSQTITVTSTGSQSNRNARIYDAVSSQVELGVDAGTISGISYDSGQDKLTATVDSTTGTHNTIIDNGAKGKPTYLEDDGVRKDEPSWTQSGAATTYPRGFASSYVLGVIWGGGVSTPTSPPSGGPPPSPPPEEEAAEEAPPPAPPITAPVVAQGLPTLASLGTISIIGLIIFAAAVSKIKDNRSLSSAFKKNVESPTVNMRSFQMSVKRPKVRLKIPKVKR